MTRYLLIATILFGSSIYAIQDLGTYGATHSIKEENFMHKVEKLSKDLNTTMLKEQFYSSKDEFLIVDKIVDTCTETKTRKHTPTFIVPIDVILPNGEVIARAGEVKNTLEVMRNNNINIDRYMMFIDASDTLQLQLSYLYKNQGIAFITNGSIAEYEKQTKVSSFKADKTTIEKFNIKCSPSIVVQQGNSLLIYEYNPEDLKKEN